MAVDFDLSCPLPLAWQGCISFDLSASSPCGSAIPCSEVIPEIPPITGSFYARLLEGLALGRAGARGILSAAVPCLGQATAQGGAVGACAASVGTPGGAAAGEWDANAWRGPGCRTGDIYEDTEPVFSQDDAPWEMSRPMHPEVPCAWEGTSGSPATVEAKMFLLERKHSPRDLAWTRGESLPSTHSAPYDHAGRKALFESMTWESGSPRRSETESGFVLGWPRKISRALRHQTTFPRPAAPMAVPWHIPLRWKHGAPQWWIPWETARRPAFIWPLHEPVIPPPPLYVGDPHFNLRCVLPVWSGCIRFALDLASCQAATPCRIFPRRFIIVLNTLSLVTLPDGSAVPCESMEIHTDLDSWTWGFKADFKGYPPDWLVEDQREVEATVNGHAWRFVLESYEENKAFAGVSANVAGRSLSAYLASPYELPRSRIESSLRTANQCAEDELYGHGWELDWRTVDWLIPPNVFAYESETPLSALKLLAEASGAVIQTHPSIKRLTVLPRYPVSTWELSSAPADIVIPEDIINGFSRRWLPEPLYRGIWVCGREQGVSVRVIRTGTDGDPYKEMIIDPLITHIDAGRERGRNILCAGGRRAMISIVIPLLASPGLVLPGSLVRVDQSPSWAAYASGLTLSARHGSVWQTVELERVYETP